MSYTHNVYIICADDPTGKEKYLKYISINDNRVLWTDNIFESMLLNNTDACYMKVELAVMSHHTGKYRTIRYGRTANFYNECLDNLIAM